MNTHGPASGGALAVDLIFSACAYNASTMRPFAFPKRARAASNGTLSFFRFFKLSSRKKSSSDIKEVLKFLSIGY